LEAGNASQPPAHLGKLALCHAPGSAAAPIRGRMVEREARRAVCAPRARLDGRMGEGLARRPAQYQHRSSTGGATQPFQESAKAAKVPKMTST